MGHAPPRKRRPASAEAVLILAGGHECLSIAGSDCRGRNFKHGRLVAVDAARADLRGTTIVAGEIVHADFKGADCRGARFVGIRFTHANFQGADLRGARFVRCSTVHWDGRGADTRGAIDIPAPHSAARMDAGQPWCGTFASSASAPAVGTIAVKYMGPFRPGVTVDHPITGPIFLGHGVAVGLPRHVAQELAAGNPDFHLVAGRYAGPRPAEQTVPLAPRTGITVKEAAVALRTLAEVPEPPAPPWDSQPAEDAIAWSRWLAALDRDATTDTWATWTSWYSGDNAWRRYRSPEHRGVLAAWNWPWAAERQRAREPGYIADHYREQEVIREGYAIQAHRDDHLGNRSEPAPVDWTRWALAGSPVAGFGMVAANVFHPSPLLLIWGAALALAPLLARPASWR